MSAVSNRVMPRSIALWITLREVSRSVRWPKLLQPRPTAETRRPELPRLRISMDHPFESRLFLPLWRSRARTPVPGAGLTRASIEFENSREGGWIAGLSLAEAALAAQAGQARQ